MLVGSESPIDVAAIERTIRSRDGIERGLEGSQLADFIDGAKLLVDDFAPVDQMLGNPTG